MPSSRDSEPWMIHFFERHPEDDPSRAVPALSFLASLPTNVAAEFDAVLNAVAEAPPPAFSGGGKWEALHGAMAGVYENSRFRWWRQSPALLLAHPVLSGPGWLEHCMSRRADEAGTEASPGSGLRSDQAVRRRVSEARDGASLVILTGDSGRLTVSARRSMLSASANATRELSVGFLCCCENKRRTAADGIPARRASSALLRPSSPRRASRERMTSSNICTRRTAVVYASAYSGSERRAERYSSAAVLDFMTSSVTFVARCC
jgi:hypothetical protein